MTFSRAVMKGSTRTSWKVRATRERQIWNDGQPAMSTPPSMISPASGRSSPVMQVQHRGLARAVRADQADDAAVADVEREIAHGDEAAEGLVQAADAEQTLVRRRPS